MDNFTSEQRVLYNTIKAIIVLPRLADRIASRMYLHALKNMSKAEILAVLLRVLHEQHAKVIQYMNS